MRGRHLRETERSSPKHRLAYIPTGEGWLYVASVLDLGSRRLLGYSMADHMRTDLVVDALNMAAGARGGVTAGVIFHGDRGSQTGFNRSSQHRLAGGTVGTRRASRLASSNRGSCGAGC